MDTGDYSKRQRNRICVVYIIAGVIIVLAAFLLGTGMWLKALILALFGMAFLMTPLALSSESERKSCLLFLLGILFGMSGAAVLIYGICVQIF